MIAEDRPEIVHEQWVCTVELASPGPAIPSMIGAAKAEGGADASVTLAAIAEGTFVLAPRTVLGLSAAIATRLGEMRVAKALCVSVRAARRWIEGVTGMVLAHAGHSFSIVRL